MHSASALLFDLCDVVFDDTMWSRCLFQIVTRMGRHPTFETFWTTWLCQYHPDVAGGRCEFDEALRRFLASWQLTRGQIDEACAAAHSRRRQFENAHRPLPGVKAAFAQFDAQGWKLGVLGHLPSTAQEIRHCLARLGLVNYVNVVLSSCELSRATPHVSCYTLAARALDAEAAETLFVSANPYAIQQAAGAGLQVVTLQAAGQAAGEYIEQLGELMWLLQPNVPQRRAG